MVADIYIEEQKNSHDMVLLSISYPMSFGQLWSIIWRLDQLGIQGNMGTVVAP